MTLEGRTPKRKLLINRTGVESLLELPKNVQRQAVRKMRTIEASPTSAGYPLRSPLQGFRGIHSGRYRIIWRLLTLQGGEEVAEVVYVGIRSEGDERDAYAEFSRLFGLPDF
jgi:mRNA-degrading endonuclease RelE of RelBE toxin-antitoxin system